MDRVEFVTNKGNHFVCGGPGGKYNPLIFDCSEGNHPRILAFGIGLGPFDSHQIRAHYMDVSGDSPGPDHAFMLELQRR